MTIVRTIRREWRIQRFVARRNPWLARGIMVCVGAALLNLIGCTAQTPDKKRVAACQRHAVGAVAEAECWGRAR